MNTQTQFPWEEAYRVSGGLSASHSTFWLDQRYLNDIPDKGDPEYLMRLSAVRRGVADFVRIVTGRDIPVKYSSGKMTYAVHSDTMEYVVISAEDDPSMIDVQVGRALHEGCHLVISKRTFGVKESVPYFSVIKYLHKHFDQLMPPVIGREMSRLGKRYDSKWVVKLIQDTMNFLEDRRIDTWQYNRAPGYKGYYRAFYLNTWLSPQVDALMMHPVSRIPTVENYRFHLINMTNQYARPDALPGLQEIWDLVDLPNIRRFGFDKAWDRPELDKVGGYPLPLTLMPEMVQAAFDIVAVILKNSELPPDVDQDQEDEQDQDSTSTSRPFDPNLDIPDEEIPTDEIRKKLREIIDSNNRATEEAEGRYEGDELLGDEEAEMMDSLESSGASINTVGDFDGQVQVLVFKRFDEALARSSAFPFTSGNSSTVSQHAIRDGERLGNVLAERLQIMGEESPLKFTRQHHGKIDKRLISGLGFESDSVFEQTFTERFEPVLLHLSLDSSGSMSENKKWYSALKLAVALAKCAEQINNLNVVISLRTSGQSDRYAYVAIVYDSRVDSFFKVRSLFGHLHPTGGTPEGLCFAAIKDIITSEDVPRRFFVNISDGEPSFHYISGGQHKTYAGKKAWEHTARQVQDFRQAGICVLSYFVGSNDEEHPVRRITRRASRQGFQVMYGKDSQFIDPESVTGIADTLNRLFLDRD